MKIGILQCGHFMPAVAVKRGGYDALYPRLLHDQGFEFETYSVVDMQFPKDVHDADGWLLSGSKHGAYEDHAFIPPLEQFIRRAYAEHVPMVGICFGHQIVAQALGGKVEKFSGGWSVGRQIYRFDGLGDVALNAWHKDQVVAVPPEAKVIASSDFCRNAALVYDDRALTIQAHPEFDSAVLADMLDASTAGPAFSEDMIARARADTALPLATDVVARQIADFFRQPRKAHHG